jgi:hypothetical protein
MPREDLRADAGRGVVPHRTGTPNHRHRAVPRFLAWLLAILALPLLLSLPAASSEQEGGGSARLPDAPKRFVRDNRSGIVWHELETANPFGVTPTTAVIPDAVGGFFAQFFVETGHNAGSNIYQQQACDPITADYVADTNGDYFDVDAPDDDTCAFVGDLPVTSGSCCASEQSWFEDGHLHFAGTASGLTLTDFDVDPASPSTATATAIDSLASRLSSILDRFNAGLVAAAFNTATNQVDFFVHPDGSSWAPMTSLTCDGPATNYHWGTTTDPAGNHLWSSCRTGGNVRVRQLELPGGALDWDQVVDAPGVSSSFFYEQADFCGPIDLGGGNQVPGVAVLSPSPTGTKICVLAGVGGPGPPSAVRCASIPGSAPDRQLFHCSGSLAYYHGAAPGGTGVRDVAVNCGRMDGPCIFEDSIDTSRSVNFAGGPPAYTVFSSVPDARGVTSTLPIRYRRLLFAEGYNPAGTASDVVRFGVLPVPFYFDNFESGDLRFWSTAVTGP